MLRDLVVGRVVKPGFNKRVYDAVRRIPKGRVSTYGGIATLLGSPRVARHVGWALAALPDKDSDVPWHRVINAQRLEEEGVEFDESERVDFSKFLWVFEGM